MDTHQSRVYIQPMATDNVEQVADLERACFSTPWSLRSLTEELSNPLAVFRVAYVEDSIVGYAGMHHVIDEGYVTNICVHPAMRRCGVARELLSHLIGYGRENGLVLLTLEVRTGNEAAIALYEGMGFERVGRRIGFYQDPVEDALILTLKL